MSLPPLNRIVAFAGPYISLAAGAAATWIVAKANALGIAGLEQSDLAQQIASAIAFTLATVLTWLGQSKWLHGHQIVLAGDAQVQAAALTAPMPAPPTAAGLDPEHDALMELGEDLPDDDEEFAAPPPDDDPLTDEDIEAAEARRPVQPSEAEAL